MVLSDIIYQDGNYYTFIDKSGLFAIVEDGELCGTIVGWASDFEKAKESIEWHKSMKK